MEKELGAVIAYADFDRAGNQLKEWMKTNPPYGPSLLSQVATSVSSLAVALCAPFSEVVANAIERERLLVEISAIANLTTDEVRDFYQTHVISLETIKAALMAGAKLDEEDIKRTMEERSPYGYKFVSFDRPDQLNEIIATPAFEKGDHTFIVVLPNNERREVKAHYMEVDGGSLYFEDDDRETILAFGPGHWVWAERVKEDTQNPT